MAIIIIIDLFPFRPYTHWSLRFVSHVADKQHRSVLYFLDLVGVLHFICEYHLMPNILQITVEIFYITNAYCLNWS